MSENREVEVWGVTAEVDYDFEEERDPYGTGDSPSLCNVIINTITIGGVDLTDLLVDSFLDKLEEEILRIERG